MTLYLDAASVLEGRFGQGSLKSLIYGPNAQIKSKPALVYALVSETAKYSAVLKEIVDNSGVLQYETKVSPLLALLLVHDLLFAKGGIAASSGHSLRISIERHKARLQAELTKARIRRNCPTINALKDALILKSAIPEAGANNIRWVRLNIPSENETLDTMFPDYQLTQSIAEVSKASSSTKILIKDCNIPGLVGLPPDVNLMNTKAYLSGKFVLQDKASCFPAYLLLGNSPMHVGDIIDACAAPGNKTTHLALLRNASSSTIYACERDAARSSILRSMVKRAGCNNVEVLARQDFLALDPLDHRFSNVTHLLLDPSCSGSGILSREDIPQLALPENPRLSSALSSNQKKMKKRKRDKSPETLELVPIQDKDENEHETRLQKLSNVQSQIINHALRFPSATRVSYSTCSLSVQENEVVVARVLSKGLWKLLPRSEQAEGLSNWPHRGIRTLPGDASSQKVTVSALTDGDLDACIRCWPRGEDCTMGFFTCCFVRKELPTFDKDEQNSDEWLGFQD